MSFTDLGIPVDAVESRTAAVCTNAAGESRIVIAAKGFLLVIDPAAGSCQQVHFPHGYSDYPYDTFCSRSGLFYMGAGAIFYVFDPFQLAFIEAAAIGGKDELCGFSYAENEQGHIYMASYPECSLYRYRPLERDISYLGSMDSEQKYPSHLAVDAYGWIYIGTGTTRKNIIAYDPDSGATHSVLPDELRTIGIGVVRQSQEQDLSCQAYALFGEQWVRLAQGEIVERLTEEQVPASLYTGASFDKFHRQLPGEWKLVSHSLSDYELKMQHASTKQLKTIELHYASEGASLSPIVLGPDGKIYGTSNHPLHFYTYVPNRPDQRPNNLGSKAIQHGAGGNIAAYAIQGNLLAGAAYPNGRLHLYDVTKPLQIDDAELRNPHYATEHIEVHRPRCAVALHDGEHIAYGGFPGYGMIGGGLCIYHLPSGDDRLIQHTEIALNQSTVALAVAQDGMLIGGTSIETPGGAEPLENTACIYMLDWHNEALLKRWRLRDGIREYSLLLIDSRGWIHTLTSCSTYFVWDPSREVILHEEDLSAWGEIVRAGWQLCEADHCIYGVLSEAIIKIPLQELRPERIGIPPDTITAGFVKDDDKLYFAISTHLWSYTIPKR